MYNIYEKKCTQRFETSNPPHLRWRHRRIVAMQAVKALTQTRLRCYEVRQTKLSICATLFLINIIHFLINMIHSFSLFTNNIVHNRNASVITQADGWARFVVGRGRAGLCVKVYSALSASQARHLAGAGAMFDNAPRFEFWELDVGYDINRKP